MEDGSWKLGVRRWKMGVGSRELEVENVIIYSDNFFFIVYSLFFILYTSSFIIHFYFRVRDSNGKPGVSVGAIPNIREHVNGTRTCSV